MTTCSSHRSPTIAVVSSLTVAGILLSSVVRAQDVANDQHKQVGATDASLEVFQGPQFKDVIVPEYPRPELYKGVEGWIDVGFMVSPEGKPYELTVVSASGDNQGLKDAALRAVEKWTFEPATLNGQPIDSSLSRKIVFRISGQPNGANQTFYRAYREFQEAIGAKDRVAADAALAKMSVKNLYEDAYFGIAQFSYAQLWGDRNQQLAGIRRAIAGEEKPKFLPKDLFNYALQERLKLELQTQDFGWAMFTWNLILKTDIEKTALDKFRPSIDQVRLLKNDGRSYKVTGSLEHGSWNYILHKRKFQINVSEGRVSQVKLRCNKAYVFFQFDPTMVYETAEKLGTCGLELLGDANTRIELIQR